MTTAVRIAAPSDARAVAVLLDAFNREFDAATPGPVVLEGRLRRLLATAGTFAVLAGEQPVAVALVTLRTNVWEEGAVALLDELYTRPEHRGRGIGSEVLRTAMEHARSVGATALEVEVDEPDHDAHRFYARHGLVLQPAGDRELVLRRAL